MDGGSFWVEEVNDQLPVSLKRKRNVRIKKLEYVGWGSKPLIEFLQSIGKDTTRTYSQQEVTTIVTEYVNSNDLLNPQKKKRVLCDARLHSLFGKKSIPRIKIYDLLEVHFSENHDESEDESSNSSKEEDTVVSSKGRKSTGSPKKKVPVVPKSCFAAVIAENIKLVYLKRSLVQDLLKTPGSSEDKIVGSFVRVKSDPNDCFQKNSHQLQQVEGIKKVPSASDAAFEIHLQLSNLMKDVPVSSLSDDDFYEEDCEDLRGRIKAGSLKRPTVLELESKAQVLHKDITKHWIEREVALLQKRIDHANEKGWRKQYPFFLERKQLLQAQKEQDRLLSVMPKVVAEELEAEVKTVDALDLNVMEQERENGCSPTSTPNEATDNFVAGDALIQSNRIFVNGDVFTADGNGDAIVPSNRIFISGDASIAGGNEMFQEQRDTTISVQVERSEVPVESYGENIITQQVQAQAIQPEVIELSDDEAEREGPESAIWHYRDPLGYIQGPFPLTLLKRWSDEGYYFDPSFSVWKVGQSPQEAVLLISVLHQYFPVY
ncbi:putative dicarboxylate transporter 2.1, chloroplastic-like [Capsicum annuum]|nr:putative dicarboxylate transporter 2.1, chloroplastic-like [Capsicum annuum]